jgi:hypothetical protein
MCRHLFGFNFLTPRIRCGYALAAKVKSDFAAKEKAKKTAQPLETGESAA